MSIIGPFLSIIGSLSGNLRIALAIGKNFSIIYKSLLKAGSFSSTVRGNEPWYEAIQPVAALPENPVSY